MSRRTTSSLLILFRSTLHGITIESDAVAAKAEPNFTCLEIPTNHIFSFHFLPLRLPAEAFQLQRLRASSAPLTTSYCRYRVMSPPTLNKKQTYLTGSSFTSSAPPSPDSHIPYPLTCDPRSSTYIFRPSPSFLRDFLPFLCTTYVE
jgi:hypothetical protein